MTGRSLDKLIQSEARRRPEIAAMLEIVEHLTDHDIDSAVVPLPWYRTALRVMRDRRKAQIVEASFKEAIAAGTDLVIRGQVEEPVGTQVFYRGEEGWFEKNPAGGASVRIPHGAHLFFCPDGIVWYNCSAVRVRDDRFCNHQVIGTSTLTQYKDDYNTRMLKLHSDAPVIATDRPDTPAGRLAGFGVNFF